MIKRAELYLNGCLVGQIKIKRLLGAWGFGEFIPNSGFAPFRALYDEWARLIHVGEDAPLENSTALALSEVEYAMDRIPGQLLLESGNWRDIAQLNIDGDLIEWEERDVFTATDRRIAGSQHVDPAHGSLHFETARCESRMPGSAPIFPISTRGCVVCS